MRSIRSFLVLVVVAAAVGAYAYFVDSKKDLTDTGPKKPKVFADASGKIDQIEIRSTAGIDTTLKKSGDTWQITAPETADADSSEVSSLVTSLESLEETRTIDEHPQNLASFGVSPARFTVAIKLTGDAATHRLDVGNKTPAGGDIYAMIDGQPKIFLISSYVEDSLNKSTFDLRDKSILKVSHDSVDGLTIDAPGATPVVLAKKGSDWMLMKPVAAKADFGSVDAIVNRIAQAKMKSIVAPGSRPAAPAPKPADKKPGSTEPAKPADTPKAAAAPPPEPAKPGAAFTDADYKAYGLDKPQATITLDSGSSRATLAIGGKFDDTSVYARDLSRPVVFTIEKGVLDDVNKKADDLRVKDIFEFRAYTATSVDLTYGGTTYSFTKTTTPAKDANASPTDTWKQAKPSPRDIDQAKFNDLLSNVSNLRADKFTDKPLAGGEDVVVSAKFGDASAPKDERVTIRESGKVAQAIRDGESGAAIVPTADVDKILAQVKELVGKK